MSTTDINWGYNCLTSGIHHGRPEPIWKLPLLQASLIFEADELKTLVVARIHNDATQFVTEGFEQAPVDWPKKVAAKAETVFDSVYPSKLLELETYYHSAHRRKDVRDILALVQTNKLSANYHPLHSHDSINLLCRIVGLKSSRQW